jgi:hypothetical protein
MICGRSSCEWVHTANAPSFHLQPLLRPPSQVKMSSTIKTLLGKIFSFLRCGPGDDKDDDYEAPRRLLVIVRSHTFVVHFITSLLIEYTTGRSYGLPSRGDRGGRVPACAHCRCSSSLCAVTGTLCCMLVLCNATRLDGVLINHSYTPTSAIDGMFTSIKRQSGDRSDWSCQREKEIWY